ncbi:hypothetical protein HPB48_021082 [Haemaphysalis longicornis]|uniref:C2H2-type domain-containing protein n=1 Tax=Haemaphysalis longicornis TaxID=44386 RepID=A0A9J6FQN4_HAELO|nr:hypothetical protein HPB48_021082 [Haemaphysalis longicornis]
MAGLSNAAPTDEDRRRCSDCDKMISHRKDMLKHERNVHHKERTSSKSHMKCDKCGHCVATFDNLVLHHRAMHDFDAEIVQLVFGRAKGTAAPRRGKGVRLNKSQGSCNSGKICLTCITATTNAEGTPEASVQVSYQKHHYGHDRDVNHLMMTPAERAEIA